MPLSIKLSFGLLGLTVALGACSSKDEPPDPFGTVSQFCLAWGQSACTPETVLACSGDTSDALTQACVATQEQFCEGLVPSTGYSSAQVASCLSAVQAAYSDGRLTAAEIATVRHRGAPCDHLIKGAQAKGGTCTQNDDCDTLSNYQCIIKGDTGTCQIPVRVENGTPCDAPDATCNAKFYCDGSNCVAIKAVGANCKATLECDPAAVCDPDTMVCKTRVSSTSCKLDSDCAVDTVCDVPAGSTTGKCLKTIQLSPSEKLCQDLQ
ncbi:MAG: hypothetical protein ABIQ16_20405 [Polyangiaceae bacterium]